MNKIFLLFYTFLTLSTFGQKRGEGEILKDNDIEKDGAIYDSSFALIIGQSKYENWSHLPGVVKDIKEVERSLKKHGFVVDSKSDIPSSEFGDIIQSFIAKYGRKENNRILIYYAGHGHTVKTAHKTNTYILPIDCAKEDDFTGFHEKAYSLEQFGIISNTANSKHILFVFDACFAGSLFKVRGENEKSYSIKYYTNKPVRHFITSGSENETVPDESDFREYFIRALESTEADQNNDGYTTGTELGIYLTEKVIEQTEGNQHPQSGKLFDSKFDEGEFVFIGEKQDVIKNNSIEVPRDQSYIDENGKFKFINDCYLIFSGSFDTKKECHKYIDSMILEGYDKNKVGYLWIPDIPSLSGLPAFGVFHGPYPNEKMCRRFLKSFDMEPYKNSAGRKIPCYCKKISNKSRSKNPEDDEIKLD